MKELRFSLTSPVYGLIDLFNFGMNRSVKGIWPIGIVDNKVNLNLGAGSKQFSWADNGYQLPQWDAEKKGLHRHKKNTVDAILAMHFLEHLTPGRLPFILSECERVLKVGGTLTTVVPHRLGGIAFQDLDHKTFWTENTWETLFENGYYRTRKEGGGLLKLRFNLIIGDCEKNLCLFSQFTKENER